MTLQFGSAISKQRLAFASTDRVSIDTLSMRPVSSNEEGWIFQMDDGSGCAHSYPHQELNQFAAQGRLFHEIGYFLPETAQVRLKQAHFLTAELPKGDRLRYVRRNAWVCAFMEKVRTGMKVTDTSIRANLH